MRGNLIVTTGAKMEGANVSLAHQVAERLKARYVERGRDSLVSLQRKFGAEAVLIVRHGQLFLHTPAGEFFFHPSMAHLRVKNLRLGKGDLFIEATGLREGMSILDCTLGLGADAIVASYVTGETGAVRGLEISPVLAEIVAFGMQQAAPVNVRLGAAMGRIEVIAADYLTFLRQQEDASVDVVYFDPMFRHPFMASVSLNPLRFLADDRPLCAAAVAEARRVARCRVVMKESSRSQEFSRLGFSSFVGGKYSRVKYGVMALEKR